MMTPAMLKCLSAAPLAKAIQHACSKAASNVVAITIVGMHVPLRAPEAQSRARHNPVGTLRRRRRSDSFTP
jgi:hypothetical protein